MIEGQLDLKGKAISEKERERLKRNYEKAQAHVQAQIQYFGLLHEKTIRTMKTLMHKIAYVHERWPTTKGDYAQLIIRLWETFYHVKVVVKRACFEHKHYVGTWDLKCPECGKPTEADFDNVLYLAKPDNITRINRWFVSSGLYAPSEKTLAKRAFLQEEQRQYWGGKNADAEEVERP